MPPSDASDHLRRAQAALEVQKKLNVAMVTATKRVDEKATRAHTRLDGHDTDIAGLRTDVDGVASVVAGVAENQATHAGRLTKLSDDHEGTVARVGVVEDKINGGGINWIGAVSITALVGVVAGIVFYTLVMNGNWDPFLAVQDGVVADVKEKAHAALLYHVFAYTMVTMAITFALCVCFLKPDSPKQIKPKKPAEAKTEQMPAADAPDAPVRPDLPAPPGAKHSARV